MGFSGGDLRNMRSVGFELGEWVEGKNAGGRNLKLETNKKLEKEKEATTGYGEHF